MSQYLWEENLDVYLKEPLNKISNVRQEFLINLYKEISNDIHSIIKRGVSFSNIGEIIKREEILNLILLSFVVNEDIAIQSAETLFFELEDAYISTVMEPAFSFDSKTLISKI